jgi:hypothetical protein
MIFSCKKRLISNTIQEVWGNLHWKSPKSRNVTYLWSGTAVIHFGSLGFDISAIPGIRSQALDIESPKVAKCDIPSELGCGHGGRNRIERNFNILAFNGSRS